MLKVFEVYYFYLLLFCKGHLSQMLQNVLHLEELRGLNSGGITGITLRIIHSGFNFESINASTSFNLLTSFLIFVSELVDC